MLYLITVMPYIWGEPILRPAGQKVSKTTSQRASKEWRYNPINPGRVEA
jgi:hypothetical protein